MEKIVNKILAEYAELGADFDNSTPFIELGGWDSLKHVRFILDLEKELKIRMTPEQLIACTSVENTISAIKL
ncbi:MAG: hypothetical protein BA863_18520 [Desulfovibrio sp. S3730MH75]|nr:MAG: hypothetical protein BA863_18520 [Desulfovibrio sp. S3730MH75]